MDDFLQKRNYLSEQQRGLYLDGQKAFDTVLHGAY